MNATDPSARIRAVFEHIAATRMGDFPLSNPALRVDTVGFQQWNQLWIGVLVTPWSVNLLLQPCGNAAFRPLATGDAQTWRFPSGEYEFFGLEEPGLGPTQMCSLFSPAFEFADHDGAVNTALEVMKELLTDPTETAAEARRVAAAQMARAEGKPLGERPMSRRMFLRGGAG